MTAEPFSLDPVAQEILAALNRAGFAAYAVGGCVRDMLMGKTPHDWDITTNAHPQQIKEVFSRFPVLETGIRHGTLTVLVHNIPYEITTFRRDGAYTDHRRPAQIRFSDSLEQDLARRDLTVNAMAYHPEAGVVDPFGGRQDLQQKMLRCVGDPHTRYTEDALRILRTLRFAAVLGFSIERQTALALCQDAHLLSYISAERVYAEMTRLLCGKHAGRILCDYPAALSVRIPCLLPLAGLQQHNPHHIYDVLTHTAHAVDAIAPTPSLRWAALLHDCGKASTFSLDENGVGHFYSHAAYSTVYAEQTLRDLRADAQTVKIVSTLIRYHDTPTATDLTAVKKRMSRWGEDTFRQVLALQRADTAGQSPHLSIRLNTLERLEQLADQISAEQQCFTRKDLALRGSDVAALGYQGAQIGKALDYLLQLVIENKAENHADALRAALTHFPHAPLKTPFCRPH